jgi:predicted nucleic acid-binding protein
MSQLAPHDLPETSLISTVTLAELSAAPLVTDDLLERSRRQAVLQLAEQDYELVPFDAACARAFGQVSTDLRRAGRKSSARTLDAMIAATAITLDIPVYTRNPRDFDRIRRLRVHRLEQHLPPPAGGPVG